MKGLGDTLLTIAVLGGILVVSAILTNLFTRAMYNRCLACGALNAKRRAHCRVCGEPLDRNAQIG
jgi:rRNA maturation endonuclease Nob1